MCEMELTTKKEVETKKAAGSASERRETTKEEQKIITEYVRRGQLTGWRFGGCFK